MIPPKVDSPPWKLGNLMAKPQSVEWRKDQIPSEVIELKTQVE